MTILINLVLLLIVVWVSITTSIMRFEHPDMTDIELFLNLPEAVLLKQPDL